MSNVIHTKAVDAVEAKPERWDAGKEAAIVRIDADTYDLRIYDDASGFTFDRVPLNERHLAMLRDMLTAILSPPPAAPSLDTPAPVASEDPRRVVGAVVKYHGGTYIVVRHGTIGNVQRVLSHGRDDDVTESALDDDTFVRWATPDECARHGLVYVDRSKPVASEARATLHGTCEVCETVRNVRGFCKCDESWDNARPTPAATTTEEDREAALASYMDNDDVDERSHPERAYTKGYLAGLRAGRAT